MSGKSSFLKTDVWLAVFLPFFLSRAIIVITGLAAISLGSMRQNPWHVSSRPLIDMLARWDSGFYLNISLSGYSYHPGEFSNVAFFPLYPMLMRLTSLGSQDKEVLTLIGVLISNFATLTAFIALYRLVRLDEDRGVAKRCIWYFCFFPTSFFLSVVYTEGLFLMLTVGAFLAARRGQWILAGAAAALSAATRSIGFLLILPLSYEWILQRPRRWQTLLPLLLIPLGLISFMVFLNNQFDDPIAFATANAAWGRYTNLGAIANRIQDLLRDPNLFQRALKVGGEIAFVLFGGIVLVGSLRKQRPSYIIYAVYCLLVPLLTLQVVSIPRYMIVIFPFFISMGIYLHKTFAFRLTLVFSTILLIFLVARWSLWYWVA